MWPTLITLWFALSGKAPQRPAPRRRPAFRRPSCRPRLEALEDRCVPATLNVTSNLDNNTPGTLRWAVGQANASSTPDTIDILTTQTIVLTQGALYLSQGMTIGGSPGIATISGGGNSGVFYCYFSQGGDITLSNLNIIDGKASNGAGAGGGICDFGATILLTSCTVSGNSAYDGGGIYIGRGYSTDGSLSAEHSTFSDNSATYGGGIYCGESVGANISYCTLSGNSATYGGGMYISLYTGTQSSITRSIVSDNSAVVGGGIDNRSIYKVIIGADQFSGNSPDNISGPYSGSIG